MQNRRDRLVSDNASTEVLVAPRHSGRSTRDVAQRPLIDSTRRVPTLSIETFSVER
jgi:hypothetical protein